MKYIYYDQGASLKPLFRRKPWKKHRFMCRVRQKVYQGNLCLAAERLTGRTRALASSWRRLRGVRIRRRAWGGRRVVRRARFLQDNNSLRRKGWTQEKEEMKMLRYFMWKQISSAPVYLKRHFPPISKLPDDSPPPFPHIFAIIYLTKHLHMYKFLRQDHCVVHLVPNISTKQSSFCSLLSWWKLIVRDSKFFQS